MDIKKFDYPMDSKEYKAMVKALEIADIDSSYDNIVENYNSGYLTINV